MKKIYALAGAALLASTAFAQGGFNTNGAKKSRMVPSNNTKESNLSTYLGKAPGDTIIYSTMNTQGDWTATSGGAGDLYTHTSGDWQWSTDLSAPIPQAQQTNGLYPSGHTTASGGYWVINSDAEGNGQQQVADLTMTNGVDLTGQTAVTLTFQHTYRTFEDRRTIRVSADDFVTYDEYVIHEGVNGEANNNTGNPDIYQVNISSILTQPNLMNVKVAFHYEGNYSWFWAIDDVAIIETAANDLRLDLARNYFDPANWIEYSMIPQSQVAPLAFDAIVTNNGGSDQTQSVMDITISGAGTANTSTATLNIPVGVTDTLRGGNFTPAALGTYNIVYAVSNAGVTDFNPGDNSGTSSFEVTTDMYGKDLGVMDGVFGPFDDDEDGLDDPYEIFPEFEVNANMDVYGMWVVWEDRTPVGQEVYYNFLKDDGTGNLVAEYDGVTIPRPVHTVANGETSTVGSEVWVYLEYPTVISVDASTTPLVYPLQGYELDSVFYALSGDVDEAQNFINVFQSGGAETGYFITSIPMMRLQVDAPFVGVEEETLAGIELGQNIPNPANATTRIPYSVERAANIEFVVTDMTGKIVEKRAIGNVPAGAHNITLNTDKMTNGIYFYSVIANGQATTKKLTVAK